MLPSENIELAIFQHVNQVGSVRQTSLPALFNCFNPTTGTGPAYEEIVNSLKALRNGHRIILWTYVGDDIRVTFDEYVRLKGTDTEFFSGNFAIEIVPEEKRYFEKLEERNIENTRSGRFGHRTRWDREAVAAFAQQLAELAPLRQKGPDHPHFYRWRMTTSEVFRHYLPGTVYRTRFINISFRNNLSTHYRNPVDPEEHFRRGCDEAQSCLEAGIEHIQRFGGHDGDLSIEEEVTVEEEVSESESDVLTHLDDIPRKQALLTYLQRKIETHEPTAILFVDLDGFKLVNDQLGHDEGDNCLMRVAEVIGTAVTGKGKLFRPGGDEYVVVLDNFTRHEAAASAERIRTAIDNGNPGGKFRVTASIGVADSESKVATDSRSLLALADAAMYRAKKAKGNCVMIDGGLDISDVSEIPNAANTAVYGETDDLRIGSRVHVLESVPGQSRETWLHSSMVWVIREVNKAKNTATATPVFPPLQGPTPTVEGPMSGPKSPFRKAAVPG